MKNRHLIIPALSIWCIISMSSVSHVTAQKPPTTQAVLNRADQTRNQKKYEESIKACERIIAMPGATGDQKLAAYEILVDVGRRQKDLPKALATSARIEKEMSDFPAAQVRSAVLQGELNLELQNKAQALIHFTTAVERAKDSKIRQPTLIRIASIHLAENRNDEALAIFERIFIDTPDIPDYWFEAQRNIADLLMKLNRHPEALHAARIAFDAAENANTVSQCTTRIATILKEIDKDVTRSNAFIEFQQFGPAGKDGATGTGDDLTNPLKEVGYPSYPQREQAFGKARETAGDDANASRLRAMTYIYSGHPPQALPHFAEAFRRRHTEPYPMLNTIRELIAIGVKSVQGHAFNIDRFYEFIRLGPVGADGQAGTADDLKDPFAELGIAPRTPIADGGLVPPGATDLQRLIELRDALEQMAFAEHEEHYLRNLMFGALHRTHIALCDYGMKGQQDWYMGLLLEAPQNVYAYAAIAEGAQASSRGSDMHFAGVRQFWKRFEQAAIDQGITLPAEVRNIRGSFEGAINLIEKPEALAPQLPPMK